MTNKEEQGILKAGDVLNNTYVVAELVASGGTGEVYRATNRVSGREIAIKILKREFAQNEQFAELMKREASVLHELVTDSVVRYYDLLESDLHGGFLFIVMEFIHGHSLNDDVKSGKPMNADVVLQVAHRVLLGLHAAHSQNLFHRDLSPDNIILKNGEATLATLIDFGIAKDVNEGAATIVGGGFAGKYQYAAPEQMEGSTDARSDLYSLGMTLLAAVRGKSPGEGASLVAILDSKAVKPDLSGIEGTLHDLLSGLVEPAPENRFQSADEALGFLEASGAVPAPAGFVPTGSVPPRAALTRSVPPPRSNAVPRTSVPPTAATVAAPVPEKTVPPTAKPAQTAKKSKTGLWLTLLVLIAAGGGGGAWYAGLLPPKTGGTEQTETPATTETAETETTPKVEPETNTAGETTATTETTVTTPQVPKTELPIASPYIVTIQRISNSDPIVLSGNLASAKAIPIITKALENGLGTARVLADVTPASGEPFDQWADKLVQIVINFKQLEEWSLSASDKTITLAGVTQSAAKKSALMGAARDVMNGLDVTFVDQLTVEVEPVKLSDINTALKFTRTCGTLTASGGTNGIIAARDTVTVTGMVAKSSDPARIYTLVSGAAPTRPLNVDLQIVNRSVCSVVQILPGSNSDKMDLEYSYGTTSRPVPADTFRLGENPVVDVVLDATETGYLNVFFVDFGDQVFHLLPHQARTENALEKIGTIENGKRTVRVAFPISDASVEQLGFKVVEPVGSNMIVSVVSRKPLFSKMRPRAESNAAFIKDAKELMKRFKAADGYISYRPLITKP